MSATCPHGLAASTCLICQTLGTQPGAPGASSPAAATATPPSGSTAKSRRGRRGGVPAPTSGGVRPDAVYPPRAPDRQGMGLGTHVVLVLAALALIGLVAWIVAGVVFAILHVLELLVIAGVAGWAGYRIGHRRGRRAPR
jgi:hypothetical protein